MTSSFLTHNCVGYRSGAACRQILKEIPVEKQMTDQTLEAINKVIEQESNSDPIRSYLGMSAIGEPCARKLWYGFRHAKKPDKKAKLINAANDGHRGEEIMADRLRMIDGVKLMTLDPVTNEQIEYTDYGLHFQGHLDGLISGLLQDPAITYVWENKVCNEAKFNKLIKLIEENGEGSALEKWNEQYYGQAQCLMHYSSLDQHYMTVNVAGMRDTISCVTRYNGKDAKRLIKKAERIIFSDEAPAQIGKSTFYMCNWCEYKGICHEKEIPETNCRTCLHSTAKPEGGWSCAKFTGFDIKDNMFCQGYSHLYLPDMLDGKPIEATDEAVIYEDGRTNFMGGRVE